MPDKLETGNHNVPAIYGLAAALDWLADQGLESIRETELRHTVRLREALRDLSGVTIYGPTAAEESVGVVSLNIAGFSPQDVASMLDASFSVQVRSGIHCAPLIHREMQSDEWGGTVRLSPGPMTTDEQIELAIEAIQEISMAAV